MAERVLISHMPFPKQPAANALLRDAGLEIVYANNTRYLTAAEMARLVGDVAAAIVGADEVSAEVIAAAPKLKVISMGGVGYDRIDVAAATRAGVVVTTTPGANHVTVAEMALALILALARHLPYIMALPRKGSWERVPGMEIDGKTLGIIGFGRIGKALAVRARALGMRVVATDIVAGQLDPELARNHDLAYVSCEDLLRQSDFVSLHASATPGAEPIIGAAQLALMKPTAYLVNAARGSLVDEGALYRALKEKRIAGAALDAFVEEPPIGNPLLELDNVIATPHAGASTREAFARMAYMAAENVLQVLQGRPCSNAVNPEVLTGKR